MSRRNLVRPAAVEAEVLLMLLAVMMVLLVVLLVRDAVTWIVTLDVGGRARIVDGASSRSHKDQQGPWGVPA